jgi:small subunit ribosomal protein S16
MATKIRLQRHGKKGKPFFHIVVADSRSPRDGKFIEKLGIYNPISNPASIELNFDRALHWLGLGAQPTDTCRAILSYKGVLYRNHLSKGVAKGALTEEQAQAKFDKWLQEKEAKIQGKKDRLANEKAQNAKKRQEAESKSRAEKAAKIAAATAANSAEAETPAENAE